jgi:CheY-like chemotaxis protein
LAARALQDFGYNVLCAANGPEALELLQRHNRALDLLITDLIMPRMDGRELAQKVRLRRPDAKLLFMSGYAGDSAARLRADVPGFTVLQKPFTAHKLAKRVREVLDGS